MVYVNTSVGSVTEANHVVQQRSVSVVQLTNAEVLAVSEWLSISEGI